MILRRVSTFLLFVVLAIGFALPAAAEVEWQLDRSLDLPAAPLDLVISADGQRIFVLLPKGEVRIYNAQDGAMESIQTGLKVDRLAVSPTGETLLLNDSAGKQVKVVALDYVKQVDIANAPIRGPKDAKVVVAVYSDFQ